mgnify:CR=1 FL=1
MYFANVSRAKATLSKLIAMVGRGEDVVIGKAGKPVAKLIPYGKDPRPRKAGQWKGRIKIAPDFDELPDDILDSFTGRKE